MVVHSIEKDVVISVNAPAADDGRVNAHVSLVMMDCRAKHARVLGQVALAQGGHDASETWCAYLKSHIADL